MISAFLLGLFLLAQPEQALVDRAYRAVALLYSQGSDGDMSMRCTATAIEKLADGSGYLFVSAAHCVGNDRTDKEKSAPAENIPFFVSFDEHTQKVFYPAKVIGVGYQHRGDDLALFEVKSIEDWPVIPVGDEQSESVGAAIINIASPAGLGKQVFKGSISSLSLDRPVVEGDINWKGALLLSIQVGGGSSGSALISVGQEKIIGFLVGTVGGTNVIGIPASKFIKFREAVEAKKYKWYQPEE
jgi:trypsin-like peptidase